MLYIIMAGGKGSRFGGEKLIAELCRKHVIDYSIEHIKKVTRNFIIATSKNSPKTRKYVIESGYEYIETPGNGYPQDVKFMLDIFNDDLLLLNGDAVFINSNVIKYFLSKFNDRSMTGITIHNGSKIYVGLNIARPNSIDDLEIMLFGDFIYLNINTKEDLMEASKRCQLLNGF